MNWKKDLDALVETTMSFVKSVKGQPIEFTPAPSLDVVEQVLSEPPGKIQRHDSPAFGAASERDEIKRHVANFRAHQERVTREREDFYLLVKARTRALIEKDLES
jgi:hypothetical protein